MLRIQTLLWASALAAGCRQAGRVAPTAGQRTEERPSILLVTLDTTRVDAIGPEAQGVETPAFDAIAARSRRFRQAYATAPETLPSHASMMTGLLPAGHGVRENSRPLSPDHPVLAERLHAAGYRTAAFVSSFVLARRFGLSRGFDLYDDATAQGRAEQSNRTAARPDSAWSLPTASRVGLQPTPTRAFSCPFRPAGSPGPPRPGPPREWRGPEAWARRR